VWHLNPGQVYQTLHSLEDEGLIRTIPDDNAPTEEETTLNERERRRYELTSRGRGLLENWLRKPPTRPNPVRDETLVRLMVLEPARPELALERIQIQEHLYREHMTRLAEQVRRFELTGGDRTTRFGLEAAILHTEAHLRWLEYCRLALADVNSKDQAARRSDRETLDPDRSTGRSK
jgi:DNA-binding PadR family transcriptional regulator